MTSNNKDLITRYQDNLKRVEAFAKQLNISEQMILADFLYTLETVVDQLNFRIDALENEFELFRMMADEKQQLVAEGDVPF